MLLPVREHVSVLRNDLTKPAYKKAEFVGYIPGGRVAYKIDETVYQTDAKNVSEFDISGAIFFIICQIRQTFGFSGSSLYNTIQWNQTKDFIEANFNDQLIIKIDRYFFVHLNNEIIGRVSYTEDNQSIIDRLNNEILKLRG